MWIVPSRRSKSTVRRSARMAIGSGNKSFVGVGFLLAFGSAVLAQDTTLRTRVDLVVVPFSIVDGDGRFGFGLEERHFKVFEDGVPQAIQEFSSEPVPLSAVVLLDTGLSPGSMEGFKQARSAVVNAFSLSGQHRDLGNADEVAVYRYDREVTQVADFTSDGVALGDSLGALDRFRGRTVMFGGPTRVDSPVINGIPVIPMAPGVGPTDRRVLHDAVYEAVIALNERDDGRRKIILIVSEGDAERSTRSSEEVMSILLGTEIQVFGIHIETGSALERLLTRQTTPLASYADLTGGVVHFSGPSNLESKFPLIAAQARSQYVLTYVSNNERPADAFVFREIEIRSSEPGEVHHKAGYYQVP